jgi:hypothetical protein
MPKINDLNVKLNVSATFPTDDAYRDALFAALGENLALREVVAGMERQENRALEVADRAFQAEHEAADLRHQVSELKAELAAAREREANPLMVVHGMSGSFALGEPDPATIRAVHDAANKYDDAARASMCYENSMLQLKVELQQSREEIARLVDMEHEASEALKELRTERDEAIQTADMVNKAYDRLARELGAERDALRAEVVRLSAPTPATQYISVITSKDLQGAYDRGVEEGRAAAVAEFDSMARYVSHAADAIAQERAIQRAKYTHAHDRRHTGVMWLSLINEAVNRHSVRDWPRTFRVVGALALAALDVLTIEGADHMGPVRKKELTTDHVEDGGSCTPPAADHAPDDVPSP